MVLDFLVLALHVLPVVMGAAPIGTQPLIMVQVTDVRGVLQAIDGQLTRVSGNVDLVRQTGLSLGDPELKGVPSGSDAALYTTVYNGTVAAIEVSPDMTAHYVEAIKRAGNVAAVEAGFLTVRSATPFLQPVEIDVERTLRDLQTSATEPQIQVTIVVQGLLERHEARLEAWISSLKETAVSERYGSGEASPEAHRVRQVLERMAEVWFRTYLAILRRTERVELLIKFPSDGIRADLKFTSADALSKVESGRKANALLALLPVQGAIRSTMETDTAEFAGFLSEIVPEISLPMETSPAVPDAWLQLIDQWAMVSDGTVALNMVDSESPGFNATFAFGINDPDLGLALFRDIPQRLKDAGLVELYERAGVELTIDFEEARRVYKGVNIHRLVYKMDITSLEQLPLGAMELTNLSADVVIIGRHALVAMGSASVNKLIDSVLAVRSPSSVDTHALGKLGTGGRFYMDYNLVGAYSAMGMVLPPNASNMFRTFKDSGHTTSTLSIGGFREDDGYKVSFLFPTDVMVALKNGLSGGQSHRLSSSTTSSAVRSVRNGLGTSP